MLRVIDDTKLTNIADAIREKTGTEVTYTDEEMPAGVTEVYDKGSEDGYNQLMNEWYDAFFVPDWRGEVTYLDEMFAYKNVDNFKFTKPFPVTKNPVDELSINRMFAAYKGKKLIPPEILNLDGATFSNTYYGSLRQTFYYILNVEECPCYNWNAPYQYYQTFQSAAFVTIGTLKSAEHTKYVNTFYRCTKLENITFDGVIGQNISFSDSPLSVKSMKNIISHLKDYSTEASFTYTVTFSSACLSALDAEGNTSPNGNTWRQYAQDLGWNC